MIKRSGCAKSGISSHRSGGVEIQLLEEDRAAEYVLRLVCRSDDEAKVHLLLMHLLHDLPITLHALHSEGLNSTGRVEVRATLVSGERQNAMLEEIVQRLSLESGISAVS